MTIRGTGGSQLAQVARLLHRARAVAGHRRRDSRSRASGAEHLRSTAGSASRRTRSDLILGVPELIAWASSFYTLHPGDVLLTGTPQGVGPVRPGRRDGGVARAHRRDARNGEAEKKKPSRPRGQGRLSLVTTTAYFVFVFRRVFRRPRCRSTTVRSIRQLRSLSSSRQRTKRNWTRMARSESSPSRPIPKPSPRASSGSWSSRRTKTRPSPERSWKRRGRRPAGRSR